MTIDQAAKRLNLKLKDWLGNEGKLVVGIDGYPGVGKTTLLTLLQSINPDIEPVNRDDFIVSKYELERLMRTTADKSKVFELYVTDNQKLESLISAFKKREKNYQVLTHNSETGEVDIIKKYDLSKKILVVEGVFMFHDEVVNHVWDRRVYLQGDALQIKNRRILREKVRWGDKYFSEDHEDSYFRQVFEAQARYIKEHKPSEQADLNIYLD